MSLMVWAVTFDFIGKLLIAATALLVHRRMIIEGKIDDIVIKRMKLEISVGVIAILFLILGYALHMQVIT
jgi:hypothetical protein